MLFETVRVQNQHGILVNLRLDQFDPEECQMMDAPESMPSGSTESFGSAFYSTAQGVSPRD